MEASLSQIYIFLEETLAVRNNVHVCAGATSNSISIVANLTRAVRIIEIHGNGYLVLHKTIS